MLQLPQGPRGILRPGGVSPVPSSQLAVPNGLVGYWPLGADTTDFTQGLTFDISGNGNHGMMTGLTTASLTQGPVGTALTFNGSSQYITCGMPAILNLTGNQVAISVFIKIAAYSNYPGIAGNINSSFLGYALFVTSGGLGFNIGGSTLTPGESFLNVWQHVVAVYNGSMTKLYANGAVIGSSTVSGNISSSPTSFMIGKNGYNSNLFNGSMCDVRVYNRALDPWEIIQLYRAGRAGTRTPWPQKAGA